MTQPHRGVDYGPHYDMTYIYSGRRSGKKAAVEKFVRATNEAADGIKEMQEAMAEFDQILHGIRRAGQSEPIAYHKIRSPREQALHSKAMIRRAKRKRGGHK